MPVLAPKELEAGMIVLSPVKTPSGQILAMPGESVTRQLINRMKLYRVESANVNIPQNMQKIEIPPAETLSEPEPAPEPKPVSAPKTYLEESKTVKQKVAASPEFQSFQLDYFRITEKLKTLFAKILDGSTSIDQDSILVGVSALFASRNTIIELFDMLNNMRSGFLTP